jgi:HAMP domain-containing protein
VIEATYIYALLGFLAVCLAAWFWLERGRARRAERLISATRRMAAGDLEARAAVRGHDDLGVLADAIAQMASRLKTLSADFEEKQDWFGLLLEHCSNTMKFAKKLVLFGCCRMELIRSFALSLFGPW